MNAREAAVEVWKAFQSRDTGRIRSVLAEDVEWIAPPGNATAVALGVTDHMVGADAIATFIVKDFRRLFPEGMTVTPISLTSEGDRVVFEQRQQATLANGRDFDLTYVFVFEMADGRARRIREYMDTRSGHLMVFGEETPRQIV